MRQKGKKEETFKKVEESSEKYLEIEVLWHVRYKNI